MSISPVVRTALAYSSKPLNRFGLGFLQKTFPNMHQRSFNNMSMVPFIVREILEDLERPSLYDQHFSMGLNPSHLMAPGLLTTPFLSGYRRPWRIWNQQDSGVSNIINDKDSFKVNLDVQQFKPEELTVKIVDNYVVVEGKHEERSDEHGYVSRHFTRRYRLPENVDAQALQSSLSSDGVLQLCAPKKASTETERTISITKTNTPAVKATEPKQSEQPEPKK